MQSRQQRLQAQLNRLFCEAIVKRDLDQVIELHGQGAEINCKYQTGNTPLHLAVWYNFSNTELISYLIENGADLNMPNAAGLTPFELHQSHYPDAVKTLALAIEEMENKMRRFDYKKKYYSFYGATKEQLRKELQLSIDAMKAKALAMNDIHIMISHLLTPLLSQSLSR